MLWPSDETSLRNAKNNAYSSLGFEEFFVWLNDIMGKKNKNKCKSDKDLSEEIDSMYFYDSQNYVSSY